MFLFFRPLLKVIMVRMDNYFFVTAVQFLPTVVEKKNYKKKLMFERQIINFMVFLT
jgi:hypothetical protein